MIECPQCNSNMLGSRCGCGYVIQPKRHDGYDNRQQIDIGRWNAEFLEDCRRWLLENGIVTREMGKSERMKAMAEYRRQLGESQKPDGLAWARKIMEDVQNGVHVLPVQKRMATEALGRTDDL